MSRGVVRRTELTDDLPRAEDLSNYRVCQTDDLVINRMSAYQGALGRAHELGIVSPDYLVLRLNESTEPRFAEYLFLSHYMVGEMTSLLRGVGSPGLGTVRTPRVNWSDLKQLVIDWPEAADQRQIADYLDAQTAKIDALIGKQEQLIETLAERRQAVISHAVTKGLDPYAPMKESGIEWIGHIPGEWDRAPLRLIIDGDNAGEVIDKSWWGDGEDVLYSAAKEPIQTNFNAFPDWKRTTGRDLLVTRNATPYVYLPLEDAMYTNVVQRFSVPVRYSRRWLKLCLDAAARSLHGYGVSIDTFNFGAWKSLQLPIPPRNQQDEIVVYLDRETAKIEALSAKAREMIEVLKERRQALISAAVTGKIDVRGLV